MAFVMRKGSGKSAVLYSRCADETYCRAELLLLLEKAEATAGPVIGYYDVDPSYPVARFMAAYKGREAEINHMLERVRNGGFEFDECDIIRLTPGVEQKSPTAEEKRQRIDTLSQTVEHYLPDFVRGVKHASKTHEVRKPRDGQDGSKQPDEDQPMMVLHQDAFAAGYHKDEYIILGLAIKYAGLHGVGVTIIGKNE